MDLLLEPILIDGRYRLTRAHSRCPGDTFDARDEKTGDAVVVRILHSAWVPSDFVERQRLGALIAHPAFVRVLAVGTDATAGRGYVVMEKVEGESLDALLERGPADLIEAVTIARALLAALSAAHSKGVVLGRIVPAEIVVRPGTTGLDVRIFSPLAKSPDQPSSDIYAVGALLFQMLTGEPPFEDGVTRSMPAPIRTELGVPRSVQQAIWRALEKKPEDRFRSAEDFSSALGY